MFKTPLGRLRWIALAEGVSYLILVGIAMPLKYAFDRPEAVRVVGMLHGVLFVAFAAALLHVHLQAALGFGFSTKVFLSSLIPFGAFWMERILRALNHEVA